MNVVVVLLLMLGGFLVMDAVGEKRVGTAERRAKSTVKYVPLSILDEQLSGKSTRDDFGDLFYSSGPWGFRDDFAGIPRASERQEDYDALDVAFAEMQRKRGDLTSSPEAFAAERRRVEERIQARIDGIAEDRMRKKSGLSASDPVLTTYAHVPSDPGERRRARAARARRRREGRGR